MSLSSPLLTSWHPCTQFRTPTASSTITAAVSFLDQARACLQSAQPHLTAVSHEAQQRRPGLPSLADLLCNPSHRCQNRRRLHHLSSAVDGCF
ncbi:hypothetical protein M0R45_021616 [Rubus argutus]|uniref:Uncharacterized protein n=1 Tax=Rubus argutus TaxID=59490 RepID=A0AAW1XC92_RUBAR